jgi:hypothetical protein
MGRFQQVKSGLRLALMTIAGFVVAAMFFGGTDYLIFAGAHSRWTGIIFLLVSAPIMIMTMTRWVKVMVAFLGLAVLNGLLSVFTGHLLANPTIPVSRSYALSLTVFFAAAAFLTTKLRNRDLGSMERILVMGFLFTVGLLISYQDQREFAKSELFTSQYFVLIGIGLLFLFAASKTGHLQSSHVRNRTEHQTGGE